MGFCTDEQYETFLRQAPQFERLLVDEGVSLTKFWFSVTPGEQHTRFAIRADRPGAAVEAQPDRYRVAGQMG